MIPLLIGCTIEGIGFGARIGSSIEAPQFTLPPYIIQSILILIAPALLAATVYMILGYVILAVDGEHHSMIRKRLLTKVFVLGDICSFMIQSTGAGLLTKKEKDAPTTGKWIIVGGLVVQLFFFGFFMVVAATFYRRIGRQPTQRSKSGDVPWRLQMWVLLVASALIFIRSVFRVVEYVQGTKGYLLRHEVYTYIFDAALMFGVVVLFNVVHPSRITGLVTGKGVVRKVFGVEKKSKLSGVRDEENKMESISESGRTIESEAQKKWHLHPRR